MQNIDLTAVDSGIDFELETMPESAALGTFSTTSTASTASCPVSSATSVMCAGCSG
ncbi:thiocillin family RiPP [Pengzhenrongella phosphoraccumulans]|uniref:thiocillin family RiPP n=1 Tax=Pengzhenrongella phosphoraccumulans TaxID=3114394 RepID=UPI003890D855